MIFDSLFDAFSTQISLRNLRKLDCYANRYPLRLKTLCPRSFIELKREMRLRRRPFRGDDAEHDRVAQRAVRRDLMVTQDAVLLGAEPLDAAPALVIEEVRAELDGDAIELLECVRQ